MATFTPSGSGGASLLPVGTVESTFGTALAVATNATVTVLSYTVPPSTSAYLLRIEVSGTNIATYDVLLNTVQFARTRTYFSGPFDGVINLGSGPQNAPFLNAGDILEIQVTNFRPTSGDFEARLQYIEV